MRSKYKIQAWWQPRGVGHGWTPCHGNIKDETKRYAISNGSDYIIAWRITKADARKVVRRLEVLDRRAENTERYRSRVLRISKSLRQIGGRR